MKKLFAALAFASILTFALAPLALFAQDVVPFGRFYTRYTGTASADNATLFTTGDLAEYDACTIMSTAGAVDVFVTLDGSNWSTAALSLQDMGSTSVEPVLVTAANRVYAFVGKYRAVRVLQNGATGASASMNCWKL
jgi:hypothetical protein